MKKESIAGAVIKVAVLLLVILGAAWYRWNQHSVVSPYSVFDTPVTGDELSVPVEAALNTTQNREAYPSEMQLYTNSHMGLSMLIPKEVGWTDHYSPVRVYEDAANNIVHIVPAKDILIFGDSNEEVAITRENAAQSEYGWHITVADASTQAELLAAIRKGFGVNCAIVSMTAQAEGLYDVKLNDEGVDSPNCSEPGVTYIKYDVKRGRVAYWDTGNGMSMQFVTGKEDIVFRHVGADSLRFTGSIVGASFWHPDSSMVWSPDPAALHKACPESQRDCVTTFMRRNGASAAAIDFYDATSWFAAQIQSFGVVTIIDVINPWRANSNSDYILADKAGEFFLVEGGPSAGSVLMNGSAIWDAIQEKLPKFSLWQADSSFVVVRGNTAIFQFDIKNEQGCHACGSGYAARVGFDFDTNGRFKGANMIDICTADESKVSRAFPLCSIEAANPELE